ncbi:RhuM family protein [Puia sp.]|jgi:hypothetical protein|uniref:RhuM family protein n=1 Tax=Puia sp. TaxID=2045100 RepID=UPI002F41235A
MEKFEILFYVVPEEKATIEVLFEEETFWLSQKKMAGLFNVEVNTINYHLKEIFNSLELNEKSTIRNFRIVQTEGQRKVEREVAFYNLDAIIAVGYRVNSKEATRFRIWATKTLREFIIKGFVLDNNRLKQGANFGKDYVTKPNMGLTTWKNAPDGKILKSDVTVAKNYLEEKEIAELNRVVTMYLDYAENQARRNIPMSMAEWAQKLDAFLLFNDYNTLKNSGSISHEIAKRLAEEQYEQYRIMQDRFFESDFDRLTANLGSPPKKSKKSEN